MSQRGRSGQFQSQTANRTLVDPVQQATVAELDDGSTLLSSVSSAVGVLDRPTEIPAATYDEQPDGSVLITAPESEHVREARPLAEPRIFTNPTSPNTTLAGSLYKEGPGQWRKYPSSSRNYLRFVNGHCAARTDQQAEKILKHFPTVGGRKRVWEEPAPLLSKEQAEDRGLDEPFLFTDGDGRVAFWTYHRDAFNAFIRTYNAATR